MKKIKFITGIILTLVILLSSGSKALAAEQPVCEWKTQRHTEFFCMSGFESREQAKSYEILVSCGDCVTGLVRTINLEHQPAMEIVPNENYEICIHANKDLIFHNKVRDSVFKCLADGGTVGTCTPEVMFIVKKPGFLGLTLSRPWCNFFIPTDVITPFVTTLLDSIPTPTPRPTLAPGEVNPLGGEVTSNTLDALNPLVLFSSPENAEALSTPGGIISRLLDFAFPLAGIILFVMLLIGGFGMLAGATNKESLKANQQRITSAIVGFILLFSSYWIIRLIEIVFGIKIL